MTDDNREPTRARRLIDDIREYCYLSLHEVLKAHQGIPVEVANPEAELHAAVMQYWQQIEVVARGDNRVTDIWEDEIIFRTEDGPVTGLESVDDFVLAGESRVERDIGPDGVNSDSVHDSATLFPDQARQVLRHCDMVAHELGLLVDPRQDLPHDEMDDSDPAVVFGNKEPESSPPEMIGMPEDE